MFALVCRGVVADRLVGEERRQKRAEGIDLNRYAGFARSFRDALGEAGAELARDG